MRSPSQRSNTRAQCPHLEMRARPPPRTSVFGGLLFGELRLSCERLFQPIPENFELPRTRKSLRSPVDLAHFDHHFGELGDHPACRLFRQRERREGRVANPFVKLDVERIALAHGRP